MLAGKLIKQPNEKYCIINYSGEVAQYNLTEQDVINMCIDDIKSYIKNAEHFGNIIKNKVSDDVLKEMGFNKTYGELIKFVPRKPDNQSYSPCDFATYGKCPNCKNSVMNGMGHTDKSCRKCGQLLEW